MRHILRFFPGALLVAVVAGCDADTDGGYQRPTHVPSESRVVLPAEPRSTNGLLGMAGSEHGVAFATQGKALHVLRSGRDVVTKDVPLRTCPMTGAYASDQTYVLADRVVMYDDDCGLWAFTDGDANPRPIVSIAKVPFRLGGREEGQGIDLELDEWSWEGGATLRSWIGTRLAFHGDSLFMCIVPPPRSGDDFREAEIWRTDLDGRGAPARIATLVTPSCDWLFVDDDAIFVEDAAPRAKEEWQGRRQVIDRIDRRTGVVTRVGTLILEDSHVADLAMTATHIHLLESGVIGGQAFSRVHRMAKTGGPSELVAGELRHVNGLRSDGESVFLAHENSILRVDGLTMTKIVESPTRPSHFSFAAGGGQLVWQELGASGGGDDAIFAMPSKATPAP